MEAQQGGRYRWLPQQWNALYIQLTGPGGCAALTHKGLQSDPSVSAQWFVLDGCRLPTQRQTLPALLHFPKSGHGSRDEGEPSLPLSQPAGQQPARSLQ